MQAIKDWYQNLSEQDQKVVFFAALFFGLVILFFGLIKPMNDKVKQLNNSISSKQSTIENWKVDLPKIIASRGGSSANAGNQNMSRIVTSSTRQFNLRVSRVQEKGANEIQVWFDNVPFNDFASWVAELNNRHQVSVASVNVRSKDRDGLSSIDVKLVKG